MKKPIAELVATGNFRKDRHASRLKPRAATGDLGEPPSELAADVRRAWEDIANVTPRCASHAIVGKSAFERASDARLERRRWHRGQRQRRRRRRLGRQGRKVFHLSHRLAPNAGENHFNPTVDVWKSTTCACCGNWVKHLEANGFDVSVHAADTSLLDRVRKDAGIPNKFAGCHTAKIDGYFIEGHVPGTDIKRLLDEKPMLLV